MKNLLSFFLNRSKSYRFYKEKYLESKRIQSDFFSNPNVNSKNYVEKSSRHFFREDEDPKLIAFYLPQFHTIPENDKWWGKGFTEWTNVSSAKPQFLGHYQPHLPEELGFYDLSTNKTFVSQIDLAKKYGIYGFCFHYYWFSGGKRLLEKPVFNFLNDTSLNFPFMFCWANEPWSRRWDGSEESILIAQDFKEEDIIKFIEDILPFFKDERYIKIDNSPALIVYRPTLISKDLMIKATEIWRDISKDKGFDNLYLMHTRTGDVNEFLHDFGFNASLDFPPNTIKRFLQEDLDFINPSFKGKIFDLPKIIAENYGNIENEEIDKNNYKTVLPSWDNTARRKTEGHIYNKSSPELYKKWLLSSIKKTNKIHPKNKLVFINAWNEWAEGCHLEPDKKYGYAYLEKTLDALMENRNKSNVSKK